MSSVPGPENVHNVKAILRATNPFKGVVRVSVDYASEGQKWNIHS